MTGLPLLAWRQLRRELRAGELRLLVAALAIAVAAVTAVGFFGDRVRLALTQQARQMIGGDLVVNGDHAFAAEFTIEARRRGLEVAETQVFPSMVIAAGGAQLADIKAASAAYPLRGALSLNGRPVVGGPPVGTVWLDERLAAALGMQLGATLQVGQATLRVGGILTDEPDRGLNFFALAPRLLMHLDDLPTTGLVQFGSRIRYRLLLAGDDQALAGYRAWLAARLERGQRLEDGANARPEIRSALDRAERFLGLAVVLTVVLAAVSVALSARRYLQRHLDACAILRCLGMSHGRLLGLHVLSFTGLGGLAVIAGSLLGFLAHFVLAAWLSGALQVRLPFPGWTGLWRGAAIAGVLLFGFAFPPLLQLARVPTLRVLRRELGEPRAATLGAHALGLLLLAGLILQMAGDLRLGVLAVIGFVGAFAAFWLLARLAVAGLARARGGIGFGWRQGLANLGRHAGSATIQIVALAIGLMSMLLLTVTRDELLAAWQQSVPADAPNRFVINIQPEQRQAVAAALAAGGARGELQPMIRARLTRIGGRPVDLASYPDDERAQRLIEREFNLSWRAELPPDNRVVAGKWFTAGRPEASVEEGLAKTLGIRLGDELLFTVAGLEKTLTVTSLRKLSWDSMRVNFFVIAPPGVIEDAPSSYITSFHLAPGNAAAVDGLVRQFPNLTVIDVGAVLRQLQGLIGQVALAIQFVFVFTFLAGAVVLYAAMLSAFDERRRELAIMRALGAGRGQLRRALLVELAAIGAIAGLIAAGGAIALGQAVAVQVFELTPAIDWRLPLVATLGSAAFVLAVGWLAVQRLLATPPLLALRSAV